MSVRMGYSVGRRIAMRRSLNSRRSMLLYGFLGILCLVRTIESGPLTESSESKGTTTLQSKKSQQQEEEVGNPSEIAYQAWLLIDGHPDSQPLGGLDSASLLRRIKPKSIFVAPNLTACPDGYQDDTMNRCVKDVNIDHQAHKGFLVQRLQAIFGHKSHAAAASSSSSSPSSSVPSGPLQLNIPLIMAAPVKTEKINIQTPEATTKNATKIVSEDGKAPTNIEDDEKKQEPAVVTVYELNEDESTFFLGNKSSGNTVENYKNGDPTILAGQPASPAVADENGYLPVDSKLPPIENYKSHNLTILVGGTIDEDTKGTYRDTPSRVKEETAPAANADDDDDEDSAPTVVLVLSPTKVPLNAGDSDLIVAHNSSLGQVIIKMENVTMRNATKEIISVSAAIASSGSADVNGDSAEASTTDSKVTAANVTTSGEEEPTESSEIYENYDEENYEDSTETEDEILKHSEAGITVTLPGPQVNSATTGYPDKESAGSSEISGEVTINRDFVRETTLVDLNVSKTVKPSTTQPNDDETVAPPAVPEYQSISTDSSDDISTPRVEKLPSDEDNSRRNESEIQSVVVFTARPIEKTIENEEPTWTEKSDSTETMIASSTNDAHQTVVSRPQTQFDIPSSKKRAGQPFSFEATTNVPHKTISNVESTVYDYYPPRNHYHLPEDSGLPLIRTIDDHHRYPSATNKQYQHFFPSRNRDYVKFDTQDQPNYVSFPSQEANSIHPNDYKERRPYNRYQQQLNNYGRGAPSPTTKKPSTTQEMNKKPSYWWVPPGWPIDSQRDTQQQRQRPADDRSRTPMLLRFWTRMPLVRDPSLNYQHPTNPTPGKRTLASPRRVNYYREMSTHDFNRAFARKTLPSAIGG